MFAKLKKADSGLFTGVIILIVVLFVIAVIMDIDYGDGIYTLSSLGVALFILLDYYLAGWFYFIAVDKGYSSTAYLKIAFIFTMIGYLLIIAMPDRGTTKQAITDELPEL